MDFKKVNTDGATVADASRTLLLETVSAGDGGGNTRRSLKKHEPRQQTGQKATKSRRAKQRGHLYWREAALCATRRGRQASTDLVLCAQHSNSLRYDQHRESPPALRDLDRNEHLRRTLAERNPRSLRAPGCAPALSGDVVRRRICNQAAGRRWHGD